MSNFRGVVDQGSLSKLRACSGYFRITSSTVVLSNDLVHGLISVLFWTIPVHISSDHSQGNHPQIYLNCPGRWKIFFGFFHRFSNVLHFRLVIEAALSLMPPAPIAWVFTQSPCNDWLPALAWGRGQQTPFSAFNSTWCSGRSCFVGEKVWIFWP